MSDMFRIRRSSSSSSSSPGRDRRDVSNAESAFFSSTAAIWLLLFEFPRRNRLLLVVLVGAFGMVCLLHANKAFRKCFSSEVEVVDLRASREKWMILSVEVKISDFHLAPDFALWHAPKLSIGNKLGRIALLALLIGYLFQKWRHGSTTFLIFILHSWTDAKNLVTSVGEYLRFELRHPERKWYENCEVQF